MELNAVNNGSFSHISNKSTTHIIYKENDQSTTARCLKWHPDYPQDQHFWPNITICSSSRGILLIYDASTRNYCLFNPFIQNSIKPLPTPPRQHHHPNSCTAILAMSTLSSSCFHVVFLTGPYENAYQADVFSSYTDSWCDFKISDSGNRILPNSYVSCGPYVFFLVHDNTVPNPVHHVLKLDIEDATVVRIMLPYSGINVDPRTVQLGRIGENIGIVIVDDIISLVVIYTLIESNSGRYAWKHYHFVKVDLERNCNIGELYVDSDGVMRIECRELPMPMRFESFKLQLLLWVDGRLVMLDQSNSVPICFRFQRMGLLQISPDSFVRGLPHVATRLRLC